MDRRRSALTALLGGVLVLAAGAASPSLEALRPRGAQRGTDLHLHLIGQRLADAEELMLLRPGLQVLHLEVENDRSLSLHLRVAEDCPLGAHPLVLRTRSGLSNPKTFHVGVLEETAEREPNGTPAQAQPIALERTIDGVLDREDEDWYAFAIAEPLTVHFDFEGVRLGDVLLDAELELFDEAGTRLARFDDSSLGRLDPIGSYAFERAGTYRLRVHETTPSGSSRAGYRLHVGTFPRPLAALPAGLPCDTPTTVAFVGDHERFEETVTLPATPLEEIAWFPTRDGRPAPTPLPLRPSALRGFVEDALPEEPPDVAPGIAWHGALAQPGETDRFAFRAAKGSTIELTVHARALRSPLDPVLYLTDESGRYLTGNDDTRGQLDSGLRFNVPADGVYRACVYDQLRRGGPSFAYRLEARPPTSTPTAQLITAPLAYPLPVVPRGGRTAALLQVEGLPDGVAFRPAFPTLPPGVEVQVPPVTRRADTVPVLFRATGEDVPPAGVASPLVLRAEDPQASIEGAFRQTFALVEVQNNRPYTTLTIDRLPIAVADVAPFAIDVVAPTVPLVQGAPLSLGVTITRREEFAGTVRLRLLWDPPGVAAGQRSVGGNQSEDQIPLNARGDAAPGRYTLCVVGYGDTATGRFASASELFELEVSEPWLRATPTAVRTSAGEDATLEVALEPTERLVDPCTFTWLYLPKGVTTPERTGPVEAGTIAFPLTVESGAALGRHRNPILRVDVQTAAGPVTHLFRGTEIRVDRPREDRHP